MTASDFQALCTDFETDDGKKEAKNPFPQIMQDEVWAERVKFRRTLKDSFPKYADRFKNPDNFTPLYVFARAPKSDRRSNSRFSQ